jgi:hypothetical protein
MAAEPGRAKGEAAVPITITFNPSSGYGFNPLNSAAPNLGTVEFIAPKACWVWTSVGGSFANVFTGEQSNHVQCSAGGNNYFTLTSQYQNTTVTIQGTDIGAPPPSPNITESVKGTIKVGN